LRSACFLLTNFYILELRLMFSLLIRIPDGIKPMLEYFEELIVVQGLEEMKNCASVITSVKFGYYHCLLPSWPNR